MTLSGGVRLNCDWQPYKNGIMLCQLPQAELASSHLTSCLSMGSARSGRGIPIMITLIQRTTPGISELPVAYPMISPSPTLTPIEDMSFSSGAPRGVFFDPDTFSKKRWKKPNEAIIHIYQAMYWGNLQWQIKDIDWEEHILWFGQRRSADGGEMA